MRSKDADVSSRIADAAQALSKLSGDLRVRVTACRIFTDFRIGGLLLSVGISAISARTLGAHLECRSGIGRTSQYLVL